VSVAVLRLGVIGAGIMGRQVARVAAGLDGCAVTAVADADQDRTAALAAELGASAFTGFAALLASGQVDAVYVGVPHHLHLPVCVQAARAGLHGLVDKPLCDTDDEAAVIEAAVRDSGTTWMTGFSYRFRSAWQRARELVAAGRIGEPAAVTDVIAEAAEGTPGWYWDPASGGGVLQLQAHHCFDRIAWVTGRPVREVSCRVHALPSGAADAAQLTARLEGGAVAGIGLTFGTSYTAPGRALFVVQGTAGQVEIDQDGMLRLHTADGAAEEYRDDGAWLEREVAAFAGAVARGEAPPATLADGRAALRCALAAAQSAATGAPVTVGEP